MASTSSKRQRLDSNFSETVIGFVHDVTPIKTSRAKGTKYFNAVLQVDRDEYHDVVVFRQDKRIKFIQAQNSKMAVKLTDVSKPIGRNGEGYDVMCGRTTDVLIVEDVHFHRKEPPNKGQKAVGEILQMASKNTVGVFVGRVAFVSAAESFPCYGNILESQTCFLEDTSGKIKVMLWDTHVGAVEVGKTYRLCNLSTRAFQGNVYLSTTKSTQLIEVDSLPGLSAVITSPVDEGRIDALSGTVRRVEVRVSRRCEGCKVWQQQFKETCINHRCEGCKMLQRAATYETTASVSLCVFAGTDERRFSVSNSVLKRYLESERLLSLLENSEAVEEHFLDSDSFFFQLQDDAVISLTKEVSSPATAEAADVKG